MRINVQWCTQWAAIVDIWTVPSCYLTHSLCDLHADKLWLVPLCSDSSLYKRECSIVYIGLVGATFCNVPLSYVIRSEIFRYACEKTRLR
jgi:hypothetical protein